MPVITGATTFRAKRTVRVGVPRRGPFEPDEFFSRGFQRGLQEALEQVEGVEQAVFVGVSGRPKLRRSLAMTSRSVKQGDEPGDGVGGEQCAPGWALCSTAVHAVWHASGVFPARVAQRLDGHLPAVGAGRVSGAERHTLTVPISKRVLFVCPARGSSSPQSLSATTANEALPGEFHCLSSLTGRRDVPEGGGVKCQG